MAPLSLIFGAVVGLSLGLTGSGGAMFAVPLLVYALHVPAQEAVGISLAAVGATAAIGALHRWRLGEVELRVGLLFAAAGMLGAPVGAWIAGRMPPALLLSLFALLMLLVAARLWQQAARASALESARSHVYPADGAAAAAIHDAPPTTALLLSPRGVTALLLLGTFAGVLSGLFGVGGGIVIVPALVLMGDMPIHRAVGTSLLVIALISAAGVASHLWAGRTIDPRVTALFVAGGVAGLLAGHRIGRHLSGPALQKVFAVAIVAVAVFVLTRTLLG